MANRPEAALALARLELAAGTFLLPSAVVAGVEPALDLATDSTAATAPGAVGVIRLEGYGWPVYALDSALQPGGRLRPQDRFCLLLEAGRRRFGLACAGFEPLPAALPVTDLPACMRRPGQAPMGLAVRDEEALAVLDPGVLATRLAALEAPP